MKRTLRWIVGILLIGVLIVVGRLFAGDLNIKRLIGREAPSASAEGIEPRYVTTPGDVHKWRSFFAQVTRTLEKDDAVQVDIKSVQDGWVAVYGDTGYVGYAPISLFGHRGGWGEQEEESGIHPASLQQINRIKRFLKPGYTLTDVVSLKSSHHRMTFYVAGRVQGSEIKGDAVALWLTSGTKDVVDMVVTVNEAAATYSTAPSEREAGAQASPTDPEARQLSAYLNAP